jgi:hypothetical protein
MPNGEKRYSVSLPDGSAWILTVAGETGGWQNAHYHKGVRETYIVQSGWMAFATIDDEGNYNIDIYVPGDVVNSLPTQHHNVYLPVGAVTHTVKHGDAIGNPDKKGNDWYPAFSDFDTWTKGMGEDDLHAFGAPN